MKWSGKMWFIALLSFLKTPGTWPEYIMGHDLLDNSWLLPVCTCVCPGVPVQVYIFPVVTLFCQSWRLQIWKQIIMIHSFSNREIDLFVSCWNFSSYTYFLINDILYFILINMKLADEFCQITFLALFDIIVLFYYFPFCLFICWIKMIFFWYWIILEYLN